MSEPDDEEREPERLSRAAASSDVLRAALDAARAERPTDAQLSAVAARVAANVAAAGAAGSGAASVGAGTSAGGAWTWVAIVAVLGGLAAGGVYWGATRGASDRELASMAADAGAAAAAVADAAAAAAPAADAAAPADVAAPDGGVLRRARPSAPDAGPTSAALEVDIDAELALLRTAQDALRADPARALGVTAEHARRFGDGTLAQEREVVAIEALVALERRVEAQTRAGRFTARWPRSAHARRLAVILGEANDAGAER